MHRCGTLGRVVNLFARVDWVLDKDTCISESGCTFAPGDDRWGAPSDAAKCLTCAMGSRARNRAAAACDGDALAGLPVQCIVV